MHDHHPHHAAGTVETSASADRRYLIGAPAVLVGFMLAEVTVGMMASSSH